ncbi:hypothetical protein ACX9MK_09090 [Corynebacterium evansiae]
MASTSEVGAITDRKKDLRELFFGDLWCVVWGYGGMRTHFSLLNPALDMCRKKMRER